MTSPLAPEPIFTLGPVAVPPAVVSTWLLVAALALGCALATRRLAARPGRLQALLELYAEALEGQIAEVTQASPRPFLPFLGTLFTFLAVANASAMVPGITPPNAQLETPAALAVCVFFAVHAFGVRRLGVRGYLRTFAHPSPVMAPFHVLSHLTRTFSLTVRLFGNVMSGEFMLGIVLALAGLLVPIPLMAFEVLVGLVQAYIFSVLAAVFVGAGRRRGRTERRAMTTPQITLILAAAIVMLGAIVPAWAEGRAVCVALESIARQPEASASLSRALFVGLAMIETMAIYCLVIALLLLFANPFAR